MLDAAGIVVVHDHRTDLLSKIVAQSLRLNYGGIEEGKQPLSNGS